MRFSITRMDPRCRWLWLSTLLTAAAWTATGSAAQLGWSVRTWQIPDGSTNTVTGVAQSPNGYLWIATTAGLNQFDGVRFENHAFGRPFGLADSRVRMLLAGRGGLWAAFDDSVVYLKSGAPPRVIRENIPSLRAESMVEDDQGALWIGYRSGRICRIADGTVTLLKAEAGVPMLSGEQPSLAIDNTGQLWVATGTRIGVIRHGRFTGMVQAPSTSFVARARDGGLWVCSGFTLYKYTREDGLKRLADVPIHRSGTEQMRLFEDRRGALWIGTTTGGLFRFDDSGIENIATPQARITCLAEDQEGNLWAGSDAGLDRVSPRAIEVEGSETGLPLGSVGSIGQAPDGRIWAVMVNGSLMVRTDGRWEAAPFSFEGVANCVAIEPSGAIWIGTRNRRLYCWKSGRLASWNAATGMDSLIITALLTSKSGDLWIGSSSPASVLCLRAGHFIKFVIPRGLGQIDAIVEDQKGSIWMGRSGQGGLLRVTADQLIDETPLVGNVPIHALWVAPDDSLWMSIYGRGIGRLKDRRLTQIATKKGLYDDYISQIVPDDRGWLWFGSDHGIFKNERRELQEAADGKLARVQSVHYGGDEGLPPLQAKYGLSPSAIRSRDGRLWLTMATGLAVIHPERIRERLGPPPVRIERTLVDDKAVATASNYFAGAESRGAEPAPIPTLPPDYHRLEFDFTALTFSSPESARFRYRLDDFDEDWNETTDPRRAIYPRLPAGNYRFRVMACNADGIWNEQGASTSVAVAPFVWQTWWFRAAAALASAATLLLSVRYVAFRRLRRRLEALEQRTALDRERARIARDIHDDLGHGLTQIVLLSDLTMLEQLPADELDSQLRQIAATARQGIKSLDETVWAINPRNDTLPDVIDYLGQFAVQSVRSAGIHCRLDLPDHPPALPVPAEVRHSLFLAVKEAVNNVLRHAGASNVALTIALCGEEITITVADDGRGFDSANGHAGQNGEAGQDGLRNMKQRMLDIGGKFQVQSTPGMGTRISLNFSVARPKRGPLSLLEHRESDADHSFHR
ncbi:MAG TPA: two-component regulator propeller domain-containing protein [Pirellulales bacterium]|nr:two-component regulator propeller domain-containing protein [Pirellulales bacterium]